MVQIQSDLEGAAIADDCGCGVRRTPGVGEAGVGGGGECWEEAEGEGEIWGRGGGEGGYGEEADGRVWLGEGGVGVG